MTWNDLKALRHIDEEIEEMQHRIIALRCQAESTTATLSDMPRGSGTSDKVGRIATEIADLLSLYEEDVLKQTELRHKLHNYVREINDSYIRRIICLHFIDGYSWQCVANRIGGGNTSSSVRMAAKRYIDRNGG